MFDIQNLVEKHFKISKVTPKEIFLTECPYCGRPNTHESCFSVSRYKKVFHCFRCGKSGGWVSLVAKLEGITYEVAKTQVEGHIDLGVRKEEEQEVKLIRFPPRSLWTRKAGDYLESRGITQNTIERFGLYFCNVGKYAQRIIIPVAHGGKQVTFQARTIERNIEPRYCSPPGAPKVWFNLDGYRRGDKVVLVEGAFDVMNLCQLGVYAICPLGKNVNLGLIKYLTKAGISAIHILQDRDTLSHLGVSRPLSGLCKMLARHVNINICALRDVKDPGEMLDTKALDRSYRTLADLDWDRLSLWRGGRN